MNITERLFSLQDKEYKDFQSKLMPTVDSENIIGVRIPLLRKLAKEIYGTTEAKEFLKELPHKYYEENNLHAFLIEQIGDYNECIAKINDFLPYIDNWATCDGLSPKILKKNLDLLLNEIDFWLKSEHTYTLRFAVKMLMANYLDAWFRPEYLEKVADIRSDEYYIKMVVAWYFQTALTKQYDYAVEYIKQNKLDIWTHNKAIQKAIESYRVSDSQKEYLRSLKRR